MIDAHAHVIVPEVLREAARVRGVRWEDGARSSSSAAAQIRSAVRDSSPSTQILAAQAEAGIDHVVLCPWVNLLGYDVAGRRGARARADPERRRWPRCGPRTRSA